VAVERHGYDAHPSDRRTAAIAGILYLVTVASSIPALALKEPVLSDPSLLAGVPGRSALQWAVILELILIVSCIGTAVVLFPVLRRGHEAAALGFVAARIIEGACIAVGVIAMLSLMNVSTGDGTAHDLLRAIHDWAFLIGPGLIPAINGLLLGYALYRMRLVPRLLPILAFIGAPLLTASAISTLVGIFDQVSAVAAVAAVPIAAWEIGLGIWLVVKGFSPARLHEPGTADGTVGNNRVAPVRLEDSGER